MGRSFLFARISSFSTSIRSPAYIGYCTSETKGIQMSYGKFVNDLKELNIKKKGKKPKVSPQKFYPSQAELQAQELLKDELNNYSARLYRGALEGGVNEVYNVAGAVPEPFKESAQQVADMVAKFNVRAFASFSELVVGERYFPSSDEKNLILNTWTENFVNLCKSTNEEMRKKAAGIISDGVLGGRNLKELVKELQTTCKDFAKTKSELIACTEVGKLNSAIARNQSESAGIEYYEWSAAMDGRTRETHANMDGRICRWGKDDVYYEWVEGDNGKRELKEKKRTEKMYHGAPGTDFRCRCVALPYVPEFEDDYERPENPQGVVQKREDETKEEPKKEPEQPVGKKGEFDFLKFDDKIKEFQNQKQILNYMAKKHGIKISTSFSTCRLDLLQGAMQGVDTILTEFPRARIKELRKVPSGRYIMATCWNGDGTSGFHIDMNNMYLRADSKLIPHRESDFHPKNSTPRQSASHEMGHAVNFWIAMSEKGKMGFQGGNAEAIAREITRNAVNKVAGREVTDFGEILKMRKSISGYADMGYDYMETIAEAVGDVSENRENANPLSKEIFRMLRARYKANFGG